MPEQIRNIADIAEQDYMDWGDGDRFEARFALLGQKLGSRGLGYNVTVVPPGKRAFPFHNHRVNDELFFILRGRGEVRIGERRHPVQEGDLIACPPGGPETAHQIINNSDFELRYLAVSTTRSPEVAQYPDSDKCGVVIFEGMQDNGLPKMWRLMMRMDDTDVDYWDGER